MKRPILILICITMALVGLAQDGSSTGPETLDSLSLKERIFYHYDRSEFTEVVNACNKALEVYKATDDFFEMAGCYSILGIAYQRLGRYKEAIESYERSTEVLEKMKESEIALHKEGAEAFYDKNIRYTRNNMATIYFMMEEYDEAEKLYLNCIQMLGTPHDTIDYIDLASYRKNLAEVSLKQAASLEGATKTQRLKEAIDLAEQAMQLSEQYGDHPFNYISKKVLLAQTYHAVGRDQEAHAMTDEALEMAGALNDAYLLAEIHAVYGEFEADESHYEAAEQHYRKAVVLATENDFEELQRTALNGAYAAARHFDKALALDYLEQSTALKDSVFNAEQQQLIRDYQVKYDLAEKDHQIELQEEKNHYNRMMITFLLILAALLAILMAVGFRLGIIRKRQNKALEKLNKTKDHLFSMVSHDFKTSMISQNLMLDVINNYYDNMSKEDIKTKLLTLKVSSEGLKDQLYNLIEWIKMELGDETNVKAPFNLRSAVDESINALKTEIDLKRLKMDNTVAPDLMANDDANIVKIVMRNLFSNAVKFSWPDGEVRFEAKEEGDKIWVIITDHGTGISKERLQCLMHDMVAPEHGTQSETGSGIGLNLCKQLLERNGGEIKIESEVGQGTTVRFSVNK